MDIAITPLQAFALALVLTAIWAWGHVDWSPRNNVTRLIVFTAILWAAFAGPIPVG